MKKPWIGITCSQSDAGDAFFLRKNYAASLQRAGGIPILLPYGMEQEAYAQIAQELDGFLFSGGMDVQPFYCGEETCRGCGSATPERDQMEMLP